jgi:hypothetical protein
MGTLMSDEAFARHSALRNARRADAARAARGKRRTEEYYQRCRVTGTKAGAHAGESGEKSIGEAACAK